MPYIINWPPAKRAGARAAGLALVGMLIAAVMSVLAAPAMADSTSCSAATLTQSLLSFGDSNWYTLAPGESVDSFDGTGWTLLGRASIVSAQLADGSTGNVLDLPGGSLATSPPMCIDLTYQTARTMIRDLSSTPGDVAFSVAYLNATTGAWTRFVIGGVLSSSQPNWTLSPAVKLQPGHKTGWQVVRFTFTSISPGSDPQLYNFYVDPYAKG